MTATEMINEFRIAIDLNLSLSAPGFTDAEVCQHLNRSRDSIVLDLIGKKDWENLRTIIQTDTINLSSDSTVFPKSTSLNALSGTLPNEFWKYVDSEIKVARLANPSTGFIPTHVSIDAIPDFFPTIFVSINELKKFIRNPFNTERFLKEYPVSLQAKPEDGINKIVTLGDNYSTPTEIFLSYVTQPANISGTLPSTNTTNCNLPLHLHRLVVEQAVKLAIQSIGIIEQNTR